MKATKAVEQGVKTRIFSMQVVVDETMGVTEIRDMFIRMMSNDGRVDKVSRDKGNIAKFDITEVMPFG